MTSTAEDLNKSFYFFESSKYSKNQSSQYFIDREDDESSQNASARSDFTEKSDYNHSYIDNNIFTGEQLPISANSPRIPQDKTINKYLFSFDSEYDLRQIENDFDIEKSDINETAVKH